MGGYERTRRYMDQSDRLPPVSPPLRARVEAGERPDTTDRPADGNVIDWARARGPVGWPGGSEPATY